MNDPRYIYLYNLPILIFYFFVSIIFGLIINNIFYSFNVKEILVLLNILIFQGIFCFLHYICNSNFKTLSSIFQFYCYLFYFPGMLLYIYDPSIGRYNMHIDNLSFESYFIGTILVCISILIIQLIINFFPVGKTFPKNIIGKSIKPTKYLIFPTVFILSFIIFVNVFMLISSGKSILAGGGMQNYGNFSILKVFALIDPFVIFPFALSALLAYEKVNKNILIFIILIYLFGTVLGGSKEAALRVVYCILPAVLVYKPLIKFKVNSFLIYSFISLIVIIILFGIGHIIRLTFQWESSVFEAAYELPVLGTGNPLEYLKFIFRRLDGLGDFYLVVDGYNESVHQYFNLKNTFSSFINFLFPGVVFDVLPSSLYFGIVFGGETLDSVKFWYTSREITIFGLALRMD